MCVRVEFCSVVNIFPMPSFGFTNGDVWKCDEVCGIECEYINHVHSLSRLIWFLWARGLAPRLLQVDLLSDIFYMHTHWLNDFKHLSCCARSERSSRSDHFRESRVTTCETFWNADIFFVVKRGQIFWINFRNFRILWEAFRIYFCTKLWE